jgi:hypothetical protein
VNKQELESRFRYYIKRRLTAFVQTNNVFMNTTDACTYKDSSITSLANKANYFIAKRDETWLAANNIIQDIKNDVRPIPESVHELMSELPNLAWP